MASRKILRPQRSRVFIGCEGKSELGYAAFVSRILESVRKDKALDNVDLRGGDPLALIQRAVSEIHVRGKRQRYSLRFLLLDADRIGVHPQRDAQLFATAQKNQIFVVLQDPCFEGMLLRHLPGMGKQRPKSTSQAKSLIAANWPNYSKPLSADQIRAQIKLPEIQAVRKIDPRLDEFFDLLGFP
jgi:hypothetical protein